MAAAGETVDVTLTNSERRGARRPTGTVHRHDRRGSGQFAVTFTSPTTGQVTGHACLDTLSVNGSAPFTVQTDGIAPNSGDAVKTLRQRQHPDHAGDREQPGQHQPRPDRSHVNAVNGTLDAGPHTATASIVSGPGAFVGSPTCTYTGGGRTG